MKSRTKTCFVFAMLLITSPLFTEPAYGFQSDDPSVAPSSLPVSLQTTDGDVIQGAIAAVGDSGLKLTGDSETLELAYKQIASITLQPPESTSTSEAGDIKNISGNVTFVDGSSANIATIGIEDETALLATSSGVTIEAKVSDLKTISFLGAEATDEEKSQWTELLGEALPTSDAIVVSKNGVLQLIEGVVGNINDQHLTFSIETRTAEVALEKIKGVLLYRAKREFLEPLCQLVLVDGGLFSIREFALGDNEVQFATVGGLKFSTTADQIKRLDFSVSRFVYLSDLIPSTNTWTPLVASPEIMKQLTSLRIAKFNHDFRNQPLALKNTPQSGLSYLVETVAYEKGIAISGGGRVVFSLNRQFKQLTGLVGFDPEAYIGGVVRFVVKTDGETAISEVMRTEELLQPIALDLDVSTTDRISISVEYEDGKLAGDVLHLVDFKVSR